MTTHATCKTCGRILAKQPDGTLPPHRTPTDNRKYERSAVPLTGPDNPWCAQ